VEGKPGESGRKYDLCGGQGKIGVGEGVTGQRRNWEPRKGHIKEKEGGDLGLGKKQT